MKSIFKNFMTITAFTLVTRMLGFFFRIFLSRTIGAEALGMYQVALSVFFVLLTIVSSGFTLIISRMTATYRVTADKKAMGTLVTSSMIVGVGVSVFLCIVIFVFRNLFANLFTDQNCMNILIILLPSLVFSAVYSVFRGAMWGNDNYFGLCASELLEQVVKIVVCVLILANGMTALQNAMSVAWSFTLSCFVSAFFVMLLYFFYGGKMNKPSKIYRQVIARSAPITGVRVASSIVQPLIALILPSQLIAAGYTSSQALSLYGVAIGMTLPFLFVPTSLIGSLSTVLVPDISMALVQNDSDHVQRRVSSSILFAIFISFLIVPVFMAVGDKFGLFLYDNALSGQLLQYSAWIMIPLGVNNITSAILNSAGLEVKSFVNYLFGEVFLFACVLILPRFIGINALIVGMGVSALVTCILNIFMIKRKLKIHLQIKRNLLLMALFSVPVMATTSFISSLLSHFMPLFFDLVISSAIGIGLFVLLCMVFDCINISFYFIKFKEKFFSKAKLLSFRKKRK